MSHLRVKTTYEQCKDPWGGTETLELYCHHNLSCDVITFYDAKGHVEEMCFEQWNSGKDKWDAMEKLWFPFKDKWGEELMDGVEYYYVAPWEKEDKEKAE